MDSTPKTLRVEGEGGPYAHASTIALAGLVWWTRRNLGMTTQNRCARSDR